MRYEFFPWRMVRSPGEENGNPLQYPCLENPMDGGTWWATVLRFTKSQTWLSDLACMLTKCSWENSVTSGAFLVGTCANGRKLHLPSSTYSASIPQVCFFPQAQGLKFPLTLLHSASPSSSHSQWLASYKTLPSPPHPPTTSSLLSSMVQTVFYLDRGSSPKFPILFCLSVPPNALANLYKMLFWSCHLIFLIKYIYQFLIVWIIKPIFTVSHLTQNVVLRVCCLEAISCEGRRWGP